MLIFAVAGDGHLPAGRRQAGYGVGPQEHRGPTEGARTVRAHVPNGELWFDHFLRGLTEPCADAKIFLRAPASRT